MFGGGSIEHVHLELTTLCNARCPMCRRTAFGEVAPDLALVELTVPELRIIFPVEFLQKIRQIDLCGVLGDPVVARSLTPALAWFTGANPHLAIELYTNGALRSARWWRELARRFNRLKVVFAIDGLENTHAIYRRGTRFEKVVENARAFIDAGGRAQWDFLVFRHNEHQVEEARRRAADFGFESFVPKFSGRFYRGYYENDPKLNEAERWDRFPIHDRDRQVIGYLQPPVNAYYVNPAYEQMAEHFLRAGSLLPHWDSVKICCSALENRSIFVAADGTVFPCCWTYGASLYRAVYGIEDELDNQMEALIQRCGGREAIDARRRSIKQICRSELFEEIARSWSRERLSAGKLKICARMCGESFDQYSGQFSDPRRAPGRLAARG